MAPLKILPIVFALAAILLVSGCAQQQAKKTSQTPPLSTPAGEQSPVPTQVGSAGDVIGYQLVRSDSIESDISDPELSELNSDLAEIEAGL